MVKIQTLDLDGCIADRIVNNIDLPGDLAMGLPSTHGESFAYLMRPLQKYINYMDGRQKRTFAFDLQAKCSDWHDSNDYLNAISHLLEQTRPQQLKSLNGSFEFIKAKLKQPPNFVAIVTDNLDTVTGKDISSDGIFSIYKISIEVTAILNN